MLEKRVIEINAPEGRSSRSKEFDHLYRRNVSGGLPLRAANTLGHGRYPSELGGNELNSSRGTAGCRRLPHFFPSNIAGGAVFMSPDHIAAWRNHVAGKLHERYGIAIHEAQRIALEWMESLEPGNARLTGRAQETRDPEARTERPINIASRSAFVQDEIVE